MVELIVDPLVGGRGRELLHEDVPMIKIGVDVAIRVALVLRRSTLDGLKSKEDPSVRVTRKGGLAQVPVFVEPGLYLRDLCVVF